MPSVVMDLFNSLESKSRLCEFILYMIPFKHVHKIIWDLSSCGSLPGCPVYPCIKPTFSCLVYALLLTVDPRSDPSDSRVIPRWTISARSVFF